MEPIRRSHASRVARAFATAVVVLICAIIIGFLAGVTVWVWKVML